MEIGWLDDLLKDQPATKKQPIPWELSSRDRPSVRVVSRTTRRGTLTKVLDEITIAPEVVSALAEQKESSSLSVDDIENLFADLLPEREQRTEEEINALFADMLPPAPKPSATISSNCITTANSTSCDTSSEPKQAQATSASDTQRGEEKKPVPFASVSTSAVSAADLQYLQSNVAVDQLWGLTRAQLHQYFKSSFSTESLVLMKSNSIGVKELSLLKTSQLLNLLKHRDESLHEGAAKVLADRIVSPYCEASVTLPTRLLFLTLPPAASERRDAIVLLVNEGGLRNLMALLSSSRPVVLENVLTVLEATLSIEAFQETFRQIGGLKPLVRTLAVTPSPQLQLAALRCLELTAAPEKNREAIMKAGGLRPLLELISGSSAPMRFHALNTLAKLATVDRVREGLLKAKALGAAVSLLDTAALASSSDQLLLTALLKLLAALTRPEPKAASALPTSNARSAETLLVHFVQQIRTEFSSKVLSRILSILDANQLYERATGVLRRDMQAEVQLALLSIIANVAVADPVVREALYSCGAVPRLLSFLTPSDVRSPSQFRFNNDALRALSNQLEDKPSRAQFLDARGFSIVLQLLLAPEQLPRATMGHAALLMFRIASSEEILTGDCQTAIVALLRALKTQNRSASSAKDPTFLLIALHTLRLLAHDDRLKESVLTEGGVALLCDLLASHQSVDILSEAADALAALCTSMNVRSAIRKEHMRAVLTLLNDSRDRIQRPCVAVLTQLIQDRATVEALTADQSSLQLLLAQTSALLMSKSADLHERVLILLDAMCSHSELIQSTLISLGCGAIVAILDLFGSPNVSVQLRSLVLVARLATTPKTRTLFEDAGIINKLFAVYHNANIRQPGSQLLQAYSTLVVLFGSSFDEFTARTEREKKKNLPKYRGRDVAVDQALFSRTPAQLVELIHQMAQRLDVDIQFFLDTNAAPASVLTNSADRVWVNAPSLSAPAPPIARQSVSPSRVSPIRGSTAGGEDRRAPTVIGSRGPVTSSSGSSIAKPPAVSPLRQSIQGAGQSPPVSPNASRLAPPSLSPRVGSQDAAIRGPGAVLGRGGSRAAPEKSRKPGVSVDELSRARSKLRIVRRLLDQGVIEPKRYWDKDIAKWLDKFRSAVTAEPNILKILFELIEVQEATLEWKRALRLLSSDRLPPRQLAQHLTTLGFAIKRSVYSSDREQEEIVYELVMLPVDFPVPLLLKAIVLASKC